MNKKYLKISIILIIFAVIMAVVVFVFLNKNAVGADTIPPKISGLKTTEISTESVKISWDTDKDTDALVNYSVDKKYCTERSVLIGKEHELTIENLFPATNYYFRAISIDSSGNQAISEDYTFLTGGEKEPLKPAEVKPTEPEKTEAVTPEEKDLLSRLLEQIDELDDLNDLVLVEKKLKEKIEEEFSKPRIIGIPKLEIGADYAEIRWKTDIESDTAVALAPDLDFNPDRENPYTIFQSLPDFVTDHDLRIIGLRPATNYHYQISSAPATGPSAISDDEVFETKALKPEIFDIDFEKIEETSATIGWKTTLPSAAIIEYSEIGEEEIKSTGDPTFLTIHSIRLSDLKFNSVYEAVVIAENEKGEKTRSEILEFKTVKDEVPPKISKITNESTLFPGEETRIQTIISWETDEPSECQMHYHQGAGESTDILKYDKEQFFVTKHVQVITAFSPATVYRFWLNCGDKIGNTTKSEDFVLFTPQKEKSIIDIIMENFEASFGWVKQIGI